jgi:hypothetical protein
MPDEYPLNFCHMSEHYRTIAGKLRELARLCAFAGARKDVLRLAASLERKGDHFDNRPANCNF